MAALDNVLDKDFVRRFLIEQKHTYEELVVEIKARYLNLKGCSLRSDKRFCNHQGIRRIMAVFMVETLKLSKTLKSSRDDFNVWDNFNVSTIKTANASFGWSA